MNDTRPSHSKLKVQLLITVLISGFTGKSPVIGGLCKFSKEASAVVARSSVYSSSAEESGFTGKRMGDLAIYRFTAKTKQMNIAILTSDPVLSGAVTGLTLSRTVAS